jgi:uncharacterized metal-binding protein YceD (DUF177 family)
MHIHFTPDRYPFQIQSPPELKVTYHIKPHKHYRLLSFTIESELHILCQRCSHPFIYPFKHEGKIAICRTESDIEVIEKLEPYEAILEAELDINDVMTDELFLHSPEMHASMLECNAEPE